MGRPKSTKSKFELAALDTKALSGEAFKPISKAKAVREALGKGIESPGDIVDYLESTYNITMSKAMASSYKAQAKARGLKDTEPAKRGPKPKAVVEGYLAPPPAPTKKAGNESELLAALEAMKPIVDNLGKDQVKRIVDLLS